MDARWKGPRCPEKIEGYNDDRHVIVPAAPIFTWKHFPSWELKLLSRNYYVYIQARSYISVHVNGSSRWHSQIKVEYENWLQYTVPTLVTLLPSLAGQLKNTDITARTNRLLTNNNLESDKPTQYQINYLLVTFIEGWNQRRRFSFCSELADSKRKSFLTPWINEIYFVWPLKGIDGTRTSRVWVQQHYRLDAAQRTRRSSWSSLIP